MAERVKTARSACEFADITPDARGRVVMRAHAVWRCKWPEPELPRLPASVTRAYGFSWPPTRAWVGRDECAGCPCWQARPAPISAEKEGE